MRVKIIWLDLLSIWFDFASEGNISVIKGKKRQDNKIVKIKQIFQISRSSSAEFPVHYFENMSVTPH